MDGTAGQADEDRLYGLMEVAERQQAALEGLAAERVALAREREALARGVRDVQIGAQGAVQSAVSDSLAEVAEMQANRDEWTKAGFMAKLERRGPKARPCVRVIERAGAFGTPSDYRVLLEY